MSIDERYRLVSELIPIVKDLLFKRDIKAKVYVMRQGFSEEFSAKEEGFPLTIVTKDNDVTLLPLLSKELDYYMSKYNMFVDVKLITADSFEADLIKHGNACIANTLD